MAINSSKTYMLSLVVLYDAHLAIVPFCMLDGRKTRLQLTRVTSYATIVLNYLLWHSCDALQTPTQRADSIPFYINVFYCYEFHLADVFRQRCLMARQWDDHQPPSISIWIFIHVSKLGGKQTSIYIYFDLREVIFLVYFICCGLLQSVDDYVVLALHWLMWWRTYYSVALQPWDMYM